MAEHNAPGDNTTDRDLQARFDVEPGTGERPATVRAAGDIDLASAAAFQAALAEAAASADQVTVDLTAVTYCDSAAIHVLFSAATQDRLTLILSESGPISTILTIAGLDKITTVIAAP
jgi:anti-sigma B factor antagonist